MTDRERAIVMAYTGIVMLAGDKLGEFYKYVEEIMERPMQTIELWMLHEEIKNRSYKDFCELCTGNVPEKPPLGKPVVFD